MSLNRVAAILLIALIAFSGLQTVQVIPAASGAEVSGTHGRPIKYSGKITGEVDLTGSGSLKVGGTEVATVKMTQKIRINIPFTMELNEEFSSLEEKIRTLADVRVGDYLGQIAYSRTNYDVDWSFSLENVSPGWTVTLCSPTSGKLTAEASVRSLGLIRLGEASLEKQIALGLLLDSLGESAILCSVQVVWKTDPNVKYLPLIQIPFLSNTLELLSDDCCLVATEKITVKDGDIPYYHNTKVLSEAKLKFPLKGASVEYTETDVDGPSLPGLNTIKSKIAYKGTISLDLEEGLVTCGLAIDGGGTKPYVPDGGSETRVSEAITAPMGTREAQQKLVCLNCEGVRSEILPQTNASIPDPKTSSAEEKKIPPSFISFADSGGFKQKHHMMQTSLIDPLRKISILLYNEWQDGSKFWITASYDFQGKHSSTSKHLEGRAVDMVVIAKGKDRTTDGLMARLAWLAHESGFDWSYNEWAGATRFDCNHVHVSEKGIHTDVLTGNVKMTGLSGLVQVQRTGPTGNETLTAVRDFSVNVGDIITTGEGAHVQIEVTSSEGKPTTVTMAGNSKIQIETPWLISVSHGKLFMKLECKSYGCSIVHTGRLSVAVKGTEFTVEVAKDNSTTVTVLEGTLEVTPMESEDAVSVSANQQLKVSGSGTLTQQGMQQQTSSINPNTLEQWWLSTQPKTEAFQVNVEGASFTVSVVSNSTLSDFRFDQSGKSILFSVKGGTANPTTGSVEVSFPSNLLNGTFAVILDNAPIQFNQRQNSTHISISASYLQTDTPKTLRVTGTVAVPEFPQ
ncbi:MAG: FecR domain-containing protein, partial [Thaumarchaeota archaeon]|nr:FecR domain-containing protein [Nitrososphaerota archaeon]